MQNQRRAIVHYASKFDRRAIPLWNFGGCLRVTSTRAIVLLKLGCIMNPNSLSPTRRYPAHRSLPLSALILAIVTATTTATATVIAPTATAVPVVRTSRDLPASMLITTGFNRPMTLANRSNADQLWRSGVKHYQAKQFRESVAPLLQLLALDAENYKARVLLGGAYFELKEYPNAVEQFELATKISPKASSAWSLLGNTRNQLKQYQEALPAFAQALALEAKNADALLGSGVAHYNLQQYDQAIVAYQGYTSVLPGKALGHAYLGDAYRRKGDQAAAISAYEKALSLDANQPIAKTGLEKAKAMKP
jgi:hypothetical protein